MRDRRGPVGGVGKEQAPDPEVVLARPVLGLGLPAVELADEPDGASAGRPLAVPDPGLLPVCSPDPAVEPVLFVPLGEVVEPALVGVDRGPDPLEDVPAVLEVVRVRPQGVVPFQALGAVRGVREGVDGLLGVGEGERV